MKLVKNFVFTVLLVSMLAFNTMAGETNLPGQKPSDNPPRTLVNDEEYPVTPDGNTDTEPTEVETSDLLYAALAALLSVY